MNTLQDMFDQLLHEEFSFKRIGAMLVERKLSERGISLTQEQLAVLQTELQRLAGDTIALDISDEQIKAAGLEPDELNERSLSLDLGDASEFDELIAKFTDALPDLVEDIGEHAANAILDAMQADAPRMLTEERATRMAFEQSLSRDWGGALDLLEELIVVATEAGDEANEEFRHATSDSPDYVVEALTRLHARACQVAREVLTLLRAGYADGAHARWRSLHEISVVAMLIAHHGPDMAERYLLHQGIEAYRAAREFQTHCVALGQQRIPDAEYQGLKRDHEALLKRFGDAYGGDYGWAGPDVGTGKILFKDLEMAAGLEHLRPYYRMASHNVHANPKGVFFKLGLSPDEQSLLLCGPSTSGLSDPAHCAAIALSQVTVTLLSTNVNIDRLVIMKILLKLERQVGSAFIEAHQRIEGEEHS